MNFIEYFVSITNVNRQLQYTWNYQRESLTLIKSMQVQLNIFCDILFNTVIYCTALHCTALHCTALHCIALHCTALRCTALHFNEPTGGGGIPIGILVTYRIKNS